VKLGRENKGFMPCILEVELFKGVEVHRNNNYSIDSYKVTKSDDFTFYQLWSEGAYKIPEEEWFKQQNLLMRIKAQIKSPWDIEILNG
jgi:hypothetical protein